jgi:hypothetical protein
MREATIPKGLLWPAPIALASRFSPFLESLCPEFLAAFVPVIPLTLLQRTFSATKSLPSTFDCEELPALFVFAGGNIAGIKELPPEDRIQQRPNSVFNAAVQLKRVWKDGRTKGVQQFTNHDATVYGWREKPIRMSETSLFDWF